MLTRGNRTNNYCEWQFGIRKDGILNRTKQYNINGLIEKLLEDFNHHYENKSLSVANGSFDGVYSKRFMGRGKSNTEGVGQNAIYRTCYTVLNKTGVIGWFGFHRTQYIVTQWILPYQYEWWILLLKGWTEWRPMQTSILDMGK